MKYEIGFDYTSDPLVPANVIMQDEDAACLFHACYPISDQKSHSHTLVFQPD